MKMPNRTIPTRLIGGTMLVAAIFLSVRSQAFAANPPVDPATHAAHVAAGTMPPDAPAAPDMANGDPALAQQISELQVKMAQLEATLAKSAPAMAPAGAPMPGMPAASPSMGMDKMKSGGQMGNMASGGGMPAMNAGAMPAPPMAGMGGTAAPAGGAVNMMGMMDKMMGMMDKMMSMPATAPAVGAPMAGGSMPAATAMPPGGMGMDKMEMAGMMGMGSMSGGTGVAMSQ